MMVRYEMIVLSVIIYISILKHEDNDYRLIYQIVDQDKLVDT